MFLVADALHPLGLEGTAPSPRTRDVATLVERYFQISLFLLIATGFTTLMGTGRLDPFSVLFVCFALFFRGYLLLKKRDIRIPERWTTYITLIYALIFLLDLFLISGSYVSASIHLVLFSLVVKLFSVQRERDHIYLAVLAFLSVLAASVLTVDTLFLGSFFIFILLAVNTFVSMEVRRSLKQATHSGEPAVQSRGERQFPISLSAFCAIMVVGIIAFSAGIFFIIPRFSAGYLNNFSSRSELVTGFGDQVKLGEIGRIKQSDNVIMHVHVENNGGQELKWRGVALTVFDGKTWKNLANEQQILTSYAGRFSLRVEQSNRGNLPLPPYDRDSFRLIRYRVTMEPIGTNVLFLPAFPIELNGRFRTIVMDETGSLQNGDQNRLTEGYEAVSQMSSEPVSVLRSRSGKYPPYIEQMYLQTPSLDPRVRELALQVTRDAHSDFDKAILIEQHLREHYGYTLNMGTIAPVDPIAYFLFDRKQGHCEYFASTMAILLRSIGVPSRVVNGFRGGEYNDLTGQYIIRARDAHSWVEVYLPAVGWTSFDPTPPDPGAPVTTFSRVRLYLDAAQEFWREWVINYDFSHQRDLTVTTVTKTQRTAYDFRRWWRTKYNTLIERAERLNGQIGNNPRRSILTVVLVLGAGILLVNLRTIIRIARQGWIAKRPSAAPQIAASIWYARMLKYVARKGYPKQDTQTPAEFIETISEVSLRDSVSKFTSRYERARFGQSVPDAEKLPELYEEIAGKK